MKLFEPSIDYHRLVSRADIVYNRPAARSYEGLPIGNGRMGTLVWTRSTNLELQINRVDFFAQDSTGESGLDDCGACAIIRIDFGGTVFGPREGYREHLRVHEGTLSIDAESLTIEIFCDSDSDILIISVDDRRPKPLKPCIEVERPRQLDPSQRLFHRYENDFTRLPGKLAVSQAFSEKRFFCRSEVCVSAFDRNGFIGNSGGAASHVVGLNDQDEFISSDYHQQAKMAVHPDTGTYAIVISSAASFVKGAESSVARIIDNARETGIDALKEKHSIWWKRFWEKSYIHLHSADGKADFVERCYTYYLYLMASASRGAFPPKFNGMIWSTRGFMREWGAQFWLFNEEAMYYPLATANHSELSDPYFDMYGRMIPAAGAAARQRWGSGGIFIPETESFNGPEILPEGISESLRAINYGEIPYEDMPDDLRDFLKSKMHTSQLGQFISENQRWAWIAQIVSGAGELGIQAWQRYECTGEQDFLKERAYPFLRGTVEFYRALPSLKKEEDGLYHLYNTNVHEAVWGAKDSIYDLAVIRTCIPLAIRASQLLDVDSELRDAWRELLANLAPYPIDEEEDSLFGLGAGTWAACRGPAATGLMNVEQVWLYPVFFEDWSLVGVDDDTEAIVNKTYERLRDRELLQRGVLIALHSRFPIMMSKVGRADDVEKLLPMYLGTTLREPPNGLSLWEGLEAMTAEHLGLAAYGLQEALLQSCGPRPGEESVINVLPACPASWKVRFSLLARGGFKVSCGWDEGRVEYIHVTSNLGNRFRLKSPWPDGAVLYREDSSESRLEGMRIEVATAIGESFLLLPPGVHPDDLNPELGISKQEPGVWGLELDIAGRASKISIGLEA